MWLWPRTAPQPNLCSVFSVQPTHGDQIEVAGHLVRLKVNGRARRVSLRLDRTRREVVATAPNARRLVEAAAFARERAAWIAARLAELPDRQVLAPGQMITLFGRPCRLVSATHPLRFQPGEPDALAGRGEGEVFARAVVRALKRRALEVLAARTDHYCQALGVKRPSVTIMDAKGRWGSCRPGRLGQPAAIRYSWRLAMAPVAVSDYVVAHECAHLLELNHGPGFWSHVEVLVGDVRPYRQWLRDHGAALHAVGT